MGSVRHAIVVKTPRPCPAQAVVSVAAAGLLSVLPVVAEVALPGVMNASLEESLKGRVLLEELNCVACHNEASLRSSSRPSPRLAEVGSRVHPDYLRAFLANPHKVKPGTTMPDVLGDRPAGERKDIAEALTHYLVSLNKGKAFGPEAPDTVAAGHGEKLFHSVGCVACHSPRGPGGGELLSDTSVPLGALEEKYSFQSLTAFLRRPHSVRPGGLMPDLRLPGQEVEPIAHYL